MITITPNEFAMLSQYVEANLGIHLKKEKEALIIARLHRVLQEDGFQSFTEYYEYLTKEKNSDAIIRLVDQITTNHTFFMREADHFFYFRDVVLPFLEKTVKNGDLRVWCAASSTGEEAYTLAMILDEFCRKSKKSWDKKILATDISTRVLDFARAGVYETEKIKPVPDEWKKEYFVKADPLHSGISDKIKNEVIFRKFNLTDPVFPFRKKFHTVFCRNVMIYFNRETAAALINRIYDCTEEGGYLFIGHSESLNRNLTKFRYIKPAIYRKE